MYTKKKLKRKAIIMATPTATSLLLKKQLCLNLSNLKIKKITSKEIKNEANNLGMKVSIANRAWTNFVQTGHPDLRCLKNLTKTMSSTKKLYASNMNKKYFANTKRIPLTQKQASEIMRDYLLTNSKAVDIIRKYGIHPNQFYSLIKELNIFGTLLGKRVLDPKKYLKLNLKKVVKYNKKPHLFEDIDELKAANYNRVLVVLDKYL